MSIFEKLEFETENEFIARVYRHKTELGLTNAQLANQLNKVLNTSYGESTLRGRGQYFNEGYTIGYEKALNDSEQNDKLKEMNDKIIELKKQEVKTRDENREYQTFVRHEARWEKLSNCIIEEVRYLNTVKPFLTCSRISNIVNGSKACLLLSDLHIGSEINTYMNTYNIDIAKERLQKVGQDVIKYCNLHKVDELNIELLGDLVSGNIHVSTRLYNEKNIIKQTMICSELLAEFINMLAMEISKVNIYFSVGNHGRVTANYKEHIDEENFEYIIKWHLETRLENVANVEFKENKYDDEIAVIEIFDKKIASVHGHKDKPKDARNKISNFVGTIFDEVHMGHLHNFAVKDGVLINGCLSGVDKYSQSLRFNNKASQVLKVYYADGNECIHNIILN